VLGSLDGVDDCFYLGLGAERTKAVPEGDVERNREDGKTSSVHFLHFPLSDGQAGKFVDPTVVVTIGCDHPNYGHIAVLAEETRAELARDLA
jgi:hypothetical protein